MATPSFFRAHAASLSSGETMASGALVSSEEHGCQLCWTRLAYPHLFDSLWFEIIKMRPSWFSQKYRFRSVYFTVDEIPHNSSFGIKSRQRFFILLTFYLLYWTSSGNKFKPPTVNWNLVKFILLCPSEQWHSSFVTPQNRAPPTTSTPTIFRPL